MANLKTPSDGLGHLGLHTLLEGTRAWATAGIVEGNLLTPAPFKGLLTIGFALDHQYLSVELNRLLICLHRLGESRKNPGR